MTGLLGPSGCGKSTLIRSIMGVQAHAWTLSITVPPSSTWRSVSPTASRTSSSSCSTTASSISAAGCSNCTSTKPIVPSSLIPPPLPAYGSPTPVTPGTSSAAALAAAMSALADASARVPSSVAKTIWAESPARSGNFSCSRSTALCDSDPGIANSFTRAPPNVLAASTMATRAVAQMPIVRRGWKAQARASRVSAPGRCSCSVGGLDMVAPVGRGCRCHHPRHGSPVGHPCDHWASFGPTNDMSL